ncbi:MAG: hypothetical protein AB7F23_06720 [Phycisphaerae bacterium]|jgi:hypothetical protein
MTDWTISKSGGICCRCEKQFEEHEQFFAALSVCADGFKRLDVCADCWEKDRPLAFYFWKTKHSSEEDNRNKFIDDDMLFDLFEGLEESTEPDKLNFRFVLMLVLMRKRMLRYNNTIREDGKDLWLLKVTGQKREVRVVDPHISEEEIDKLTENIGLVLLD